MTVITMEQKSHVATDKSMDVDVFLVTVEKRRPKPSQKARYSIVSNVNKAILETSSSDGPNPRIGNATPHIIPIVLTANSERAAVPASILPLITESLYIGWERSVERLPLVLSLFMASKPKAKPMIGPKKTISDMKEKPIRALEKMAMKPA